jgi:hypothetical protein
MPSNTRPDAARDDDQNPPSGSDQATAAVLGPVDEPGQSTGSAGVVYVQGPVKSDGPPIPLLETPVGVVPAADVYANPKAADPRAANNLAAMPPPRGMYSQATYYTATQRDILASHAGLRVASYTMAAAGVTADDDGNKIVYEGTTVQNSSGKVVPRTSGTCLGVLWTRVNLRDGDVDVPIIVAGALREDKCTDNGTFGTVASGAKTAMPFIQWLTFDA